MNSYSSTMSLSPQVPHLRVVRNVLDDQYHHDITIKRQSVTIGGWFLQKCVVWKRRHRDIRVSLVYEFSDDINAITSPETTRIIYIACIVNLECHGTKPGTTSLLMYV